jgi:hypothetical protein
MDNTWKLAGSAWSAISKTKSTITMKKAEYPLSGSNPLFMAFFVPSPRGFFSIAVYGL